MAKSQLLPRDMSTALSMDFMFIVVVLDRIWVKWSQANKKVIYILKNIIQKSLKVILFLQFKKENVEFIKNPTFFTKFFTY